MVGVPQMLVSDIHLLPLSVINSGNLADHGRGAQGVKQETERVSSTWLSGPDVQAGEIREASGDPTHVGKPPLARW